MSSVETGQMSAVETGQMSVAETGQMSSVARTGICLVSTHNVQVSEVSTVAISQCSSLRKSVRPQIDENGPKWVQNGRQVVRIGPLASPGHFLASGTGPAAQNRQNIAQTPDQPPPAAAMLLKHSESRVSEGFVSESKWRCVLACLPTLPEVTLIVARRSQTDP